MQSLLENLPDNHRKIISKVVSINELTVFSLMLNKNTALVGTNKKLIIAVINFLFFKKIAYVNWGDMNKVQSENINNSLVLNIVSISAAWKLKVDKKKVILLSKLIEKIESYMKNN